MSEDRLGFWRTGRKVKRTIYARVNPEGPSDDDVLIGMMDTPELAQMAVDDHNEVLIEAGLLGKWKL